MPLKETDMKCRICGRQDARIRLCELKTARITKRAHVDCNGHSEYRSLTVAEIDLAPDCEAYKPNVRKADMEGSE